MEYVEGERLDDYCTHRCLTSRQRLDLFRKVCAAVSYAHQHLVIHRDLKIAQLGPENPRSKEAAARLAMYNIVRQAEAAAIKSR